MHDSADTGILISSSSGYTGSGSYETILDCDSHHNDDTQCDGSNADGFGAKKGSGVGNVFDGCRSWDNSDDGFDFYAWTDVVTVKNSWAFGQGGSTAGTGSNGNGFKMGGDKVSAAHVMSSCFAFDNNETAGGSHVSDWGFTNNSNPATIKCTGCGAWNNKGGSFQSISHSGDVTARHHHRQGERRQAQRRRQPPRHHHALGGGRGRKATMSGANHARRRAARQAALP